MTIAIIAIVVATTTLDEHQSQDGEAIHRVTRIVAIAKAESPRGHGP
jgi:hypothetical protein